MGLGPAREVAWAAGTCGLRPAGDARGRRGAGGCREETARYPLPASRSRLAGKICEIETLPFSSMSSVFEQ